jgi:HK97 gp10 family phage protein
MAVEGLDRLNRKLALLPQKALDKIAEAMEQNATELVAEMQRRAPKKSGRLAASIGWTWGDAPKGTMTLGAVKTGRRAGAGRAVMRITIYAGGRGKNDPFWAWFQEFGTSLMRANPFFFPTYRQHKSRMKSRATKAFREAVRNG